MGVDYTPVAGFTVPLTKETLKKLDDIAPEGWEDEYETIFDALDIDYEEIGSSYTGDTENIPLFVPEDAVGVDEQISQWLADLNAKMSTSFEIEDVIFVKELRIW